MRPAGAVGLELGDLQKVIAEDGFTLSVAGAAVVVLGLLNIQSGLVLSGIGHARLPLMSPGAVMHPC